MQFTKNEFSSQSASLTNLENAVVEFRMFPNPTNNNVNIEFTFGVHNVELSVKDMTGKSVVQKKYVDAEKISFNISDYGSGLYFLQLNIDGKQIVKKLVVDSK